MRWFGVWELKNDEWRVGVSDEMTPYAMAVELQRQGADSGRIRAALRTRGLDDEGIALLLSALGTRGEQASTPQAEWAEPPAAPAPTAPPAASTPEASPASEAVPCPRCGAFITLFEMEPVLGVSYCRACAARPEVNYPRAYRDANWGKRDGWAWLFGGGGLLSLLVGSFSLLQNLPLGAAVLFSAACNILFWTGHSLGRPALLVGVATGFVASLALGGTPNILGLLFVAMALMSTRNKLFYKIEVPEAALAKAWREAHDNQPARWAVATGAIVALAMLTWMAGRTAVWVTLGLAGLPVVLGGIGLSRVDPRASPPVGRRGQAIAGIVLGAAVAVAAGVALLLGWTGL